MRILVGCFTAQRFEHRRKLCYETWWHDAERYQEIDRFWVVGAAGLVTQTFRIDDWLFTTASDDWAPLIHRTQALCRWALTQGDFDYLVKCDDDTLILWDRFMRLVREHLAAGHEYVGNDYLPPETSRSFSGSCYLLSRRAAAIVADHILEHDAGQEDGSVGVTMTAYGIPHSREERFGLACHVGGQSFPRNTNDVATANVDERGCNMAEMYRGIWRHCGPPANDSKNGSP